MTSKEYFESLEENAPENLDLLDVDKVMKSQKFCVLSFAEPKFSTLEKYESLVNKEFLKKYLCDYTKRILATVSADYNIDENEILEKYGLDEKIDDNKENFTDEKWEITKNKEDAIENHFFKADVYDMLVKYNRFKENNKIELDKHATEFFGEESFASCIKFKGAFGTLKKANKFVNDEFKKDKIASIYVAQSGAWVKFNPDSREIEKQKTTEKKMNNLMWQYRKNQVYAEKFYKERKDEMIKNRVARKIEETMINSNKIDKNRIPELEKALASENDIIDDTPIISNDTTDNTADEIDTSNDELINKLLNLQ